MRKELDELLCQKYPNIFANRYAPVTQTAMCWGFDCGDGWFNIIDLLCAQIENHLENNRRSIQSHQRETLNREMAKNGDWTFLYERYKNQLDWLEKNLEREKQYYLDAPPTWFPKEVEKIPQVVADQVKEKYGTLRFYYTGGDRYIDGLVSMAEAMSGRTCEVCGHLGKFRTDGWISTLCDAHAEQKGYGPVSVEV